MEQEMTTQNWNMVSEVELVYKSKVKASQRPQLRSVASVHEFLRTHWDENKIELVEQFKMIMLNKAYRVLGFMEVSTGGISSTVVDPRVIFTAALKLNASVLILAHNHPSCDCRPSQADQLITQKIKDAGKLLDIQLADHMIISSEGYLSFADEGLL